MAKAKVKEVHIRCAHCGHWIPSPIAFGDIETFDASTLIGNQVQCPKCSHMTGCDKENMRVRYQGGGFIGHDT